jgi:predicted SnoaL-like aldol condensation-catalyzing enzyme
MKPYLLLISSLLIAQLSGCGGSSEGKQAAEVPAASSISSSSSSSVSSVSSKNSTSNSSSVSSTSSMASVCNAQECETKNKEMVQKIYTEVMNKNQTNLIETMFDQTVVLHGVGANNGSTGETAYLQSLRNNTPLYVATVKHIAAEGAYVAVQWHLSTNPKDEFSGQVVVDLYKISGDKIVEHWFLAESLFSPTASGNSLFSDLYQYSGAKPIADEVANKKLVTSVYLGLFNDKNLALIDESIAPSYLQHNPYVPNGSAALRAFVSSRTPGGLSFFVTLADDDLVWTFSGNGNLTLVDIFRVDNKKIVEHYDVF